MGNLLVIIISVFAGVPLYAYSRCQQFFHRTALGKGGRMRTNNGWARIVGTILMTVFLSASPAEVYAARIPKTAQEHRAMAQSYRLKAIAYEQEAETHRLMCEEYKFEVAIPGNHPAAGPSLMEAQKQCERYARDTTDLVENARELAEYHTAQAKALDGHS